MQVFNLRWYLDILNLTGLILCEVRFLQNNLEVTEIVRKFACGNKKKR